METETPLIQILLMILIPCFPLGIILFLLGG
jgi:hypothetical protein